ncbi:NAD-dependent succinate-semialdehyde dehydrogenase [Paraburkholderia sp. CNPSo 3281]|uniref:NAD-dependent succinate-semialdehyde dehydrogenase n=1 Tax=Paraburkholderia sp. CNPSo 3281 TaxID=2940933 RepID=UPI0020B7E1C0|nr:NAD-dependent succinate-semialdehyde dehydrogenase [Paraburkholderia sp. CNPSo 3281]MCP3717343.1 NAD-dependent succinate-semialdehyde dehydrogenase [Paraburkholderia sp. CNPSo 3281]
MNQATVPSALRAQLRDGSLLETRAWLASGWEGGTDGRSFPVSNPATGEILARVASLGASEIEKAVASSALAQEGWQKRTSHERARILRAWYDLIIANADDLAFIMTSEQGKPLSEARGEIMYAASFVDWFAEEAKRIYGDVIPHPQSDKRILVIRQPIGVCAAITPWNFPAAMITRKVAPALAAGSSIIVRPADLTPLTALALAVLAERAGIPAGVFQVVCGPSREIGAVLTSSPIVRKLSFTGSTEVGRLLMSQSSGTIKRLSLELGGNAPFIVFDDADLDAAIEGAMASKYRNSGQTCVCANRFLVQAGIHDRFVDALARRVQGLNVGNGTEPGVQQGPLIQKSACDHLSQLIDDAVAKGARIVTGGKGHRLGGTFFEPTVIADATPAMRLAREELFGPVGPVFRFDDEAEAIAMANDTEYGLAAYLYTRDHGRIWRVGEALEYGMVGLNTGVISNEVAPFGGVKQSGFGREGSRYGIEEYLEIKYMCAQI